MDGMEMDRVEEMQDGEVMRGRAQKVMTPPLDPLTLQGSVPGSPGRARVRYSTREDLGDASGTPWAEVAAGSDFTAHFQLEGLTPATTYHYAAETSSTVSPSACDDGTTCANPLPEKAGLALASVQMLSHDSFTNDPDPIIDVCL